MLATVSPTKESELLARHKIIGEELLSQDAYPVWQRSQSLSPQERYAFLSGWVLPSAEHPTFRLQTDFTPADSPRKEGAAKSGVIHTGGELVSPAAELVRTTAELGQLDDLAAKIQSAAAMNGANDERSVLALLLLVDLARGDDAAAGGRLKQISALAKDLPEDLPIHKRYAEVVVVRSAIERSRLQADALALAELLSQGPLAKGSLTTDWRPLTLHLLGLAKAWGDPAAGDRWQRAAPAELTQWIPVNHATAEGRGTGLPPPSWRVARGQAEYLTGNGRDGLYFRSPLLGDFELRCQVTTDENKQMQIVYGDTRFSLSPDGTSLQVRNSDEPQFPVPFPKKPENWGPWADVRLVVKDGAMTFFVGDQQVHSARLAMHFDPWLTIRTPEPHFLGSVRNVQILGSPTVPRELRLFAGSDLAGGWTDYFGSSWEKTGEEIVSQATRGSEGSFTESLLQYHRPLVEDGELEFEFYYEPGKVEVHPALDRLAFLLSPEGVRLHWLTDGAYERNGLAPDNSQPLDGSTPVELKPREWNGLKLILKGDEATILVNGSEVARRKLESTNLRTIGWFHYSDASKARIRSVVLRGTWPTELPAVESQELSSP